MKAQTNATIFTVATGMGPTSPKIPAVNSVINVSVNGKNSESRLEEHIHSMVKIRQNKTSYIIIIEYRT